MVAMASHESADRLADAALLLLDAARAVVADQEAKGVTGENRTAHVTALAVQAVMAADHWPAGGMKADPRGAAVAPKTAIELTRGAAMGIGLILAGIPDPLFRTVLALMVSSSVQLGEQMGLKARAGMKGGDR